MSIFLSGTTDKLQLITSSAATIDVNAGYVDAGSASGTVSAIAPQNTAISSATTTDIVGAPGSSTIRNVKQFTARNKDASLSCDVTVQINVSGTLYQLHKVTLGVGDCLQYIEGVGFFTLTSTAKLNALLYAPSDVVFATAATFADITGLTIALKSGKHYAFEAHLFHTNNASTTGSQFGINIGAAPTLLVGGNISAVTNSVTAGVVAIGTATARDTAFTAQTTGQTAIGETDIAGFIIPSADGTFALRATSEVSVAAGLTVKAGSWLMVRETDN